MTFDLKPEESDAILYPYLKNEEKNIKYKKSKHPLNIPHSYWISFAPDTRIRLASIFFAPY